MNDKLKEKAENLLKKVEGLTVKDNLKVDLLVWDGLRFYSSPHKVDLILWNFENDRMEIETEEGATEITWDDITEDAQEKIANYVIKECDEKECN